MNFDPYKRKNSEDEHSLARSVATRRYSLKTKKDLTVQPSVVDVEYSPRQESLKTKHRKHYTKRKNYYISHCPYATHSRSFLSALCAQPSIFRTFHEVLGPAPGLLEIRVGAILLRFLAPPSSGALGELATPSPSLLPNTVPGWGVCGGVVNGMLYVEEEAVMLGTGAIVGVRLSEPWLSAVYEFPGAGACVLAKRCWGCGGV